MPKPPRLKLSALKTGPRLVTRAPLAGLMAELAGFKRANFKPAETPEKKPVGAGRGGKHYGKVSSMGRMAESAVPAKRAKRDPGKPGGIK